MRVLEKQFIYKVISCQRVLASVSMRKARCCQSEKESSPHFIKIMDAKFRASMSVIRSGMLWQSD